MRSDRPGWGVVVTLTAMLLVSGLIGPTRVVATGGAGGGPYDVGATELERILNVERVQAGLTALPIDTFLADKARDGVVACLADPSLVMEGRAKDLAVNGWVEPSPHYLRLCPTESITDAMNAWGYTGWRGEIIAFNGGYSTDPGWYPSDCGSPSMQACEFLTYFTVSVAATGFMEEPGHKAIVLGAFDRFACGSWISPAGSAEPGDYWYDCMFAEGGPNPTVSPPTTAPTFPPQAPTSVEAVTTNKGDVLVSWDTPPGALASPISAYTVTSSPDGRTCATAGALWCTVTGLTPGTPYTFTVRATNGDGTGPPSDASNTVVVPVTAGTVSRLDASTQYPGYTNDRYATAASVSAATFDPGVPVVYIASGLNFPDALAGAAAGGYLGGPVLLVNGTIPAVTAAELARLQPTRIVVLGGPASVSEAILAALGGYTAGTVSRLDASTQYPGYTNDRYATAASVSAATFDPGVPVVYIASGLNFPDALAGAAAGGYLGGPVLLVNGTIPAVTAAELARLQPTRIVVLGGPASVSEAILAALGGYTAGTVSRLDASTQYPGYTNDRYATAASVSAATFDPGVPVVYIASGLNFPDALAGAAAGGYLGGPVLLVNGTIPAVTAAELARLQPTRIVVLGGPASVSEAILAALGGYL